MKERPIIFSADSVRAILDGRKSQTRRVVTPQPKVELFPFIGADNKPTGEFAFVDHPRVVSKHLRCPYGVPGDRLWVRETWSWRSGDILADKAHEKYAIYAADNPNDCGKYKSAMFMPRWASRITLEITSVRVQRVQEISADDCIAEGLSTTLREHDAVSALRTAYEQMWNSLNAKRGYPWESNPWVWVLEFKRIEVSA